VLSYTVSVVALTASLKFGEFGEWPDGMASYYVVNVWRICVRSVTRNDRSSCDGARSIATRWSRATWSAGTRQTQGPTHCPVRETLHHHPRPARPPPDQAHRSTPAAGPGPCTA